MHTVVSQCTYLKRNELHNVANAKTYAKDENTFAHNHRI